MEYAKIREQFGRTIGSFQSIKHLAADMLCRTEQVRALAWDTAVAAEDLGERPVSDKRLRRTARDARATADARDEQDRGDEDRTEQDRVSDRIPEQSEEDE